MSMLQYRSAHGLKLPRSADETPGVESLRTVDIDKAAETCRAAFKQDPIWIYIHKAPGALNGRISRVIERLYLTNSVLTGYAITINKGDALLLSVMPKKDNTIKHSLIVRLMAHLTSFLISLLSQLRSPEQKRRLKELSDAHNELDKFLKTPTEKLWYIDTLVTAPNLQGQGFGHRLLNHVLDYKTSRGRGAYLYCTASNIAFYQSFGFVELGKRKIGSGSGIEIFIMFKP